MAALVLFLVFFILINTFLLLGIGKLVYSYSYLSNISPDKKLQRRENIIYYRVAIYPTVALIAVYIAAEFMVADNVVDTVPEMRSMLIFCVGHFIISIMSVTVAQFLQTRHKANVIFIIANVIAGGGYLYAALFGFLELAKH